MATQGTRNSNGELVGRYGNILQTLTVVGVALGGLYAGIIAPIHDSIAMNVVNIARLRDEMIRDDERLTDRIVTALHDRLSIPEHQEFKLRVDRQMDALKEEMNIVKKEADYLRENQVTRNEQGTHWDQAKADVAELRKQIDDLRKDFGGQYTVAEKIKDLQAQLDQMRTASGTSHIQLVPSSAPGPVPRP